MCEPQSAVAVGGVIHLDKLVTAIQKSKEMRRTELSPVKRVITAVICVVDSDAKGRWSIEDITPNCENFKKLADSLSLHNVEFIWIGMYKLVG